jgi:DNA-binding transcriptional regulator YdaS (Cro superfamily)
VRRLAEKIGVKETELFNWGKPGRKIPPEHVEALREAIVDDAPA